MSGPDTSVFEQRLSRTQAEMERRGIDFLFVTPSSDMIYLLGYPAHPSERLTLLGVPQDGEPFVVVPELESVRLNDRRNMIDIHAWKETESPVELVARLVEQAEGASIAINDQTWAGFLLALQREMPDATFVSGTPVLRELRMIKDEQELEYLREASNRTDRAWVRFIESTTFAGRTESELARELLACQEAEGLYESTFMIVASGPGSASPHYLTGDRVVQEGEPVLFDFGSRWHHYTSDVTRMVHVGEPDDEYRRVYDIVLQANRATLEAVKPGMACEDVDRTARDVIEAAGYGEYFIHRVGHGLGLDAHEEPYMVGGNRLPLQPGMVFSDEPGIYLPDRFGVRIEDTLVCTETGAECINYAPRELTIVH